jgi:hypothetical protein
MATLRAANTAWFAAILLASSAAFAQHETGSGEEGTPDPQPRRIELEQRPVAGFDRPADGPPPVVVRRPPRILPYYEWAPIPWGYKLKMGSGRFNLLLIGTMLFGGGHFATQLSSIAVGTSCSNNFRIKTPDCGKHVAELQAPVVGPFFAFAGHGAGEPKWAYPLLGGIQSMGFLMILVGATLDDKRLERDDRAYPLSTSVRLAPTIAPGNYGLGLSGSF